MFKGHQIVKLLNDNWVFDFTTFTGYSIKLDKDGQIKSYKEAFSAEINNDEVIFEKHSRVPLKIMKEASNQIRMYQSNMVEEDEQFTI